MKNKLFQFGFDIDRIRNDYYKKENENEFSNSSSVEEDKKTEKENERKIIKPNETIIIGNKNKLLNFNVNKFRNDYYKKVNENDSSISSISSCQKTEQNSSHNLEDRIPIDYIENNSNDDYNDNLDSKDNKEKSMPTSPIKPIYYIPFKKIFKEDIKEIDIDELKYNDYKENEKFIIPAKQIRGRTESNKIFPHENLNSNMNYINQDFLGGNKNEFNSHNIFNLQNNSNNNLNYFKIEEEEQKFFQQLQIGLTSLLNNGNVNNYILNNYINNSQYQNNIINNINNINKTEKCTITFRSKNNDSSIGKISKIQDNNDKSKNNINLNDIINGKEKRTVVKLSPIPQNYSSFDVIKLLDYYLKIESGKNQRIYKAFCAPQYKFMGKNMGYCFVMMVKPKYVIDFYKTFNGKILRKKKCKKPCQVIWADIQGEEFLKFGGDDPFRKPIIFKDIINDKDDK